MYKKIKIAPDHIDTHQRWVDLCLETADNAEGVDGVIVHLTNARFLYDHRSDSDPALVKRNIQMQFAFSDISDTEWFRDDRIPVDGSNDTQNQLEYHTLTKEFLLKNPFIDDKYFD
jgi:hypothetical protein